MSQLSFLSPSSSVSPFSSLSPLASFSSLLSLLLSSLSYLIRFCLFFPLSATSPLLSDIGRATFCYCWRWRMAARAPLAQATTLWVFVFLLAFVLFRRRLFGGFRFICHHKDTNDQKKLSQVTSFCSSLVFLLSALFSLSLVLSFSLPSLSSPLPLFLSLLPFPPPLCLLLSFSSLFFSLSVSLTFTLFLDRSFHSGSIFLPHPSVFFLAAVICRRACQLPTCRASCARHCRLATVSR